jgi:hypothetical protein
MADQNREPPHGLDDHALLRAIHEGTASETGEKVFGALVEHLCPPGSTPPPGPPVGRSSTVASRCTSPRA